MANSNTLDGNTSSHGQQKKTLAAQLDRLDTIIDALDEALPGAVADAVQQAVSAAVKQAAEAVLREVLGNPGLLRALNPQPTPPAERARKPSPAGRVWSWLCGKVVNAGAWLSEKGKQAVRGACSLARTACAGVRRAAAGIWGLAGWARRHPVKLAVATLVGLAVGVAGYLGGPAVSSGMLGLAGALSSLVGSTLAPVFRLLSGWQSPDART
jgi:hypothetical protein